MMSIGSSRSAVSIMTYHIVAGFREHPGASFRAFEFGRHGISSLCECPARTS